MLGGGILTCPKCDNRDPLYFGLLNGKPYCRRCCLLRGTLATPTPIVGHGGYDIPYDLTPAQESCAREVIREVEAGRSILVHAVCGAGKTEITYPLLAHLLNSSRRVGFAIPRREVVLELAERFRSHFPSYHVRAVLGGQNDILEADLLVMTTHQLFRYPDYFDLLIIDEVDAFPFQGNETLQNVAKKAAKLFVYLSATPPSHLLEQVKRKEIGFTSLTRRHHGFLLPVPAVVYLPGFLALIPAILETRRMVKAGHQVFVFAPTISLAKRYYKIFGLLIKRIGLVHSKAEDRRKVIEQFRGGHLDVVVTTSVLERGVTVAGLQVIVLEAHHPLYTASVLVQIAGRSGRKSSDPIGKVVFYGLPSPNVKEAIRQIEDANKLPSLL